MDVLILLVIIFVVGMLLYEVLNGGYYVYFDVVLLLMFFLLIGCFLDYCIKMVVWLVVKELLLFEEYMVLIYGVNGIILVQVDQVVLGDWVCVLIGVCVFVDGCLVDVEVMIDWLVFIGESDVINYSQDDYLSVGEVNFGVLFDVIVIVVGQDIILCWMVVFVEQVENVCNCYIIFVDKVVCFYVLMVYILVVVVFVVWWVILGDLCYVLNIVIVVLIIICFCVFGFVVLVVLMVVIGKFYELGFFVIFGLVLEWIVEIECVVFDKIGILIVFEFDVDLFVFGFDDQLILLVFV